jgi:hypothetical protein
MITVGVRNLRRKSGLTSIVGKGEKSPQKSGFVTAEVPTIP